MNTSKLFLSCLDRVLYNITIQRFPWAHHLVSVFDSSDQNRLLRFRRLDLMNWSTHSSLSIPLSHPRGRQYQHGDGLVGHI